MNENFVCVKTYKNDRLEEMKTLERSKDEEKDEALGEKEEVGAGGGDVLLSLIHI